MHLKINSQHRIKTYCLTNNLRIDFNKLALLSPQLLSHLLILDYKIVMNFQQQSSLIALTTAIMRHIFQFDWSLPADHLCPRIPNRLNYLLWLYNQSSCQIKTVIDIGTGASLIYPLLGWRMFKWKFIATQIDQLSYQWAMSLIRDNRLEHDITLLLTKTTNYTSENILLGTLEITTQADMVMCNPPFFDADLPQQSLSVMSSQQHHTAQGEYGFFFKCFCQSYHYPRIKQFSCLIGLGTDYRHICTFLRSEYEKGDLASVKFGEIKQGSNVRYIVLWSIRFGPELLKLHAQMHK